MSFLSTLRNLLRSPRKPRRSRRPASRRLSWRPMVEILEDRTCPSGTWTELAPAGPAPLARYGHNAVEDQAHDRMIVFGGEPTFGNLGGLNDVWVLSHADGVGGTPTWTQLTPLGTPPSGRDDASAVYDPSSNEMIVFGGDTTRGYTTGLTNDTWVLTNADGLGGTPQWIQLAPSGTPPETRWDAGAAYDVANNRMIIVGGHATGALHDVWVLENANGLTGIPTWIELNPAGTAPPYGYEPVGYDPASNRVIVFDTSADNTTRVLSNANGLGGTPVWTELSPTGTPPSPRAFFGSVYDPAMNQMTVFGGTKVNTGFCNEVYTLAHANGLGGTPAWTQVSAGSPAPDPRLHTTAVFNPTSRIMTVFGGTNETSAIFGDVWVIALSTSSTATAGGTEGSLNSSVLSGATFTDANPGDHSADMTAVITWGDNGPTSLGVVSYSAGVYTVAGAHLHRGGHVPHQHRGQRRRRQYDHDQRHGHGSRSCRRADRWLHRDGGRGRQFWDADGGDVHRSGRARSRRRLLGDDRLGRRLQLGGHHHPVEWRLHRPGQSYLHRGQRAVQPGFQPLPDHRDHPPRSRAGCDGNQHSDGQQGEHEHDDDLFDRRHVGARPKRYFHGRGQRH